MQNTHGGSMSIFLQDICVCVGFHMKLLNFHVSTFFIWNVFCWVSYESATQTVCDFSYETCDSRYDHAFGIGCIVWGGWEVVEVFSTWVISDEPGDSMSIICTLSEIWVSYETITTSNFIWNVFADFTDLKTTWWGSIFS